MGKKAPKAPDPYQTADAQGKLNKETAITNANLSHVNQTNPYGSQTWTQTGTNADGTPIYTQSQTLSEPIQKQFDAQNANTLANLGAQGNLYSQIANRSPMDLSSAGSINYGLTQDQLNNYENKLQSTAGNASNYNPATYNASTYNPTSYNAQGYQGQGYNAATAAPSERATAAQAATVGAGYGKIQNDAGVAQDKLDADLAQQRDAYYRQQQAFLDPQWQQQQKELAQQLANSGVVQNSEAYNQAMDSLNRQREFAYNNARNQAIQSGGAEQTRLQNMALAAGQFHNQAQQQGFGQSLANAQMANQGNQFNANAANDMSRFNIGNQNQINQFNANTQNQAGQYNSGVANAANQFNAGAANQAAQTNAAAANNAGQFNAGSLNQAGQFNAGSLNNAGQFNAGANNAMNQFNANLNNQAVNQAANMRLSNAGMNNAAQAQAIQQLFQLRNQPMNELNALRQGTSVQMPNFVNTATPQMAAPDLQGGVQNNYNQQLASYNNKVSGLYAMAPQVGSAVLAAT